MNANIIDSFDEIVFALFKSRGKQMRTMHEDTSLSQQQKHDKMMQLHETTGSQINDVLAPEQQKKVAELKAQQKMHHEGMKPKEQQPQQ